MNTATVLNDSARTETHRTSAQGVFGYRVLASIQECEQLAPWWNTVLAASPESTPWQSWDFVQHWWQNLAEGRELCVISVERAGRPELILPLQLTRSRMLGLPVRALEPIGMWFDVNRPRLAIGAGNADAYACGFEAIWQLRRRWDLIRIDERLLDDPEVRRLERFCADRGLLFRHIFSHLCPYLDLRQRWHDYLQARGTKLRKNLRAARRKLDAMGHISLRVFSSPQEIEIGFQIVLKLHGQSWKHDGRVEHSKSTGYQNFYHNWLTSMAERRAARILVLFCGDHPVAATVAFTNGTQYHSSQIVHNNRFAHCSPGTLLESMELEELMNDGQFATYDFMGSFLNNKLRWTDTAHHTSAVFAMQYGLKMCLIDIYYFFAKPRVKQLLQSARRRFERSVVQD